MQKSIIILFSFFTAIISGQDCSCEDTFKWVKDTFEHNDAGYSYALEVKGKISYEKHNESFKDKVKGITDKMECAIALSEWLQFFRNGHLSINAVSQNNNNQNQSSQPSDDAIRESFKNSERLDVDLEAFKTYLSSKSTLGYEGIWVSKPYTIGVKKIDDTYVGFIVEADGVYWTKGQVKFKIYKDNSASFYMRDHSEVKFDDAELLGNNYLLMGFIDLKRTFPKSEDDIEIENYFKIVGANQPYYEKIDDYTTYLRIPSFRGGANKKVIDSVISTNKDEILKTENLIIDIRNNGGGSDGSYAELLPIMYTNPYRIVGVELYSTELNNKRMLDFINDPKYGFDDDDKKWAQESYDKLSKHIGEFVNLNENVVSVNSYDEEHEFPKKIAVIINENNGSTAEQFLLEAKQSKKVKLYGNTTAGVLDISNMYFVRTPCNDFELGYALSRSMRIPHMAIDDKGIQPDYHMDKSIPKYKWLDFVKKSLKE